MTRQDYIKIADVLAKCKHMATSIEAYQAIGNVQLNIAMTLMVDNPRFNIGKFDAHIERRVEELYDMHPFA
jgi:hypothetical protein